METTQAVSSLTDVPIQMVRAETIPIPVMYTLATLWIELKPERVQEPHLAADGAEMVSLSLNLTIHQPQTVTFDFSGSGISITFNEREANHG